MFFIGVWYYFYCVEGIVLNVLGVGVVVCGFDDGLIVGGWVVGWGGDWCVGII